MKAFLLFAMMLLVTSAALYAAPEAPLPPVKPFRMVFKAYDGDPRIDKLEKFDLQVETLDIRQPSVFLKVGDKIPGTHFKLLKFVFKEVLDTKLQEKVDASELIILNVVTKKTAVLPYGKVVDVSTTEAPDGAAK